MRKMSSNKELFTQSHTASVWLSWRSQKGLKKNKKQTKNLKMSEYLQNSVNPVLFSPGTAA